MPRIVEVYVDVPANVHVNDGGGERAAGVSGGRIRIVSAGTSQDEAEEQIAAFGDAVKEAVAEPVPQL